MRKTSLVIISAQILLLFAPLVFAAPSLPVTFADAPLTNDTELRHFSDKLMTYLGKIELDAAAELAQKNSHIDDATTQKNLTHTFEALRKQLNGGRALQIRYIQRSAFGRSFIRHQYELENDLQTLRCMLTYRRKTDGWRVNQLWCS